jgi:hypothetical protein
MRLFGKGYRWWKNCLDHHDNMTLPMHNLTGKIANKKRSFLKMDERDLNDHFEELKKEAEPIASWYVREETGEATLRDTYDGLSLPSFFIIRGCAKFCQEKIGVRISITNKVTVMKRPAFDGADATNSLPSWHSYCEN